MLAKSRSASGTPIWSSRFATDAGITGEITAEGIGEMIRERIGEAAAALRSGLRERSEAVPGAALVPGFAVGDTALVGDDLDRAMTESSLAHLTAVSGANCALVTGAVIWLLGRLGAGRRLRAVAAGCGLALFVVLVGPDPSVQRAAVMAAVLLASGFGGKRATALPSLGLAVIALTLNKRRFNRNLSKQRVIALASGA